MTTVELKKPNATGRFSVSESGMRELNAGRQPWDLVKELIQNAWDEAEALFAIECRVTIEPQSDGKTTMVTVEDDGSGFNDIADAYTLMGHTDKRAQPTKRGRFNIGGKDVISVAIEAEVETVGHSVAFPPREGSRDGSKEVAENSRAKGTLVRTLMPWDERQSDELIEMLRRFRPTPTYRLLVNDLEVPPRPATMRHNATLQTVTQDAPGKPMRPTQRRTEIHFVEPRVGGGDQWLYEMGIPVQPIECPWDVDVMQKVPLSQQRDSVSEAYLNRIYAETLNATHGKLEQGEFGTPWVKRAIGNLQITAAAVKATAKGRYGSPQIVFSSLDQDANNRAHDAGYGVVNPNGLSKREMEAFRKYLNAKPADEVFPTLPSPLHTYEPEPGSDKALFAMWVSEMGVHCNLKATTLYFDEPDSDRLADCSASTASPTLRFNAALLGERFFEPPYGSVEHWDLLLHEFGHALSVPSATGHGERWGEGVSKAGALIAFNMLGDQADRPDTDSTP